MSDDKDNLRKLEGLLFASKKPLSIEEIEIRMPEGAHVLSLLNTLKEEYETRGFQLTQTGNKWSFKTAADLADVLEHEKQEERSLSRAAMETLAIIAYHQPVTRAEIENIRGVTTSRGTLDILMESEWVKPGRRRQVPGKPLTWVTTESFLDHFGLETIMGLPGLEEMKASGLMDKRPAIDTLPGTPSLFEDEELEAQKETDDESEKENA